MSEPSNGGTQSYRVAQLEKQVDELAKKLDRLHWAVLSLAISITSGAVVLLITAETVSR